MRYYPLFVNLENKHCLVVGAGGVGKRKIRSLVDAGAGSVTIVDTCSADEDLSDLIALDSVHFKSRQFNKEDLDDKFLVFACTSNEAINRHISELCHERAIMCNIADLPEGSSFIVPATVRRGDITIALSTAGHSPALAKRMRKELQDTFGEEYGDLLTIMGRVRPLLLGLGMKTEDNTTIFRALVNSDLLEAMGARDLDVAREILKESLPQPLHANIPELLHGLV